MSKKISIIFMLVALAAIGAYLYFKRKGKFDGTWRWQENPTHPHAIVEIKNNVIVYHGTWGSDLPVTFIPPNIMSVTTDTGEERTATLSGNILTWDSGSHWEKIG